jgi:uncharacterized lipoprotein NlpE involved in copper resistance
MKNYAYIILIFAVLNQACGETHSGNNEAGNQDSTATANSTAEMAHNSENSLNWLGTYEGILPCEDCDEIQASITLEEKGRYSRKLVYKGKSNTPLLSAGKFVWDDEGSMITLQSFKGNHQVFKVGENKLIFQTPDEESQEYVLTKVSHSEKDS